MKEIIFNCYILKEKLSSAGCIPGGRLFDVRRPDGRRRRRGRRRHFRGPGARFRDKTRPMIRLAAYRDWSMSGRLEREVRLGEIRRRRLRLRLGRPVRPFGVYEIQTWMRLLRRFLAENRYFIKLDARVAWKTTTLREIQLSYKICTALSADWQDSRKEILGRNEK